MKTVALIGNPNSGKTSLFNQLTGLNQKVGNFPGVTVDKKTGVCNLQSGKKITILDLPGTYSLYAKSSDEQVVSEILTDPQNDDYPDALVVIVDASNAKRNMLLLTQCIELGLPTVLALNMVDLAERMGKGLDLSKLKESLGIPVVPINARKGIGVSQLKEVLEADIPVRQRPFLDVNELAGAEISTIINEGPGPAYTRLHQLINENSIDEATAQTIQTKDTTLRYGKINRIIKEVDLPVQQKGLKIYTDRIDRILTHKIWGYLIFVVILFAMFQAIFTWASWPMDLLLQT